MQDMVARYFSFVRRSAWCLLESKDLLKYTMQKSSDADFEF